MWTRDSLYQLVQERLRDYLFIAVSNREPYLHVFSGRKIAVEIPASGLTVALDPIMQACGGTWIAHGSGDADNKVVDSDNKVGVPPGNPRYSLKRVWLTKDDEEGHYYGLSNQTLWPLCHIVYTRPVFSESHWNTYRKVNEIFARSVLDEVGNKKAIVFIQDYHLSLAARYIKEGNPNIITALFWHIPWPNPEAFRICPWQTEILHGLLSNNLLGFHIRYHCNNFLETVERAVESRIDRERYEVTHGGKRTAVRPYPISVDFEALSQQAQGSEVAAEIRKIRTRLGLAREMIVGAGFDRLDYTKGIPDRFRAIDRFFERYPEYKERVVFVQAGVPSRTHIPAYQRTNEEIDKVEGEINWKHSSGYWKPIIFLREHLSPTALMAIRRLANFFVVSSLHDGMNLVAKEFAASRYDEDGVLILSRFTGASRELTDALLVNPYATDAMAEAIKTAIEMPREERQKRMRKMREIVRENNIYKWAGDIVTDLLKFEFGA